MSDKPIYRAVFVGFPETDAKYLVKQWEEHVTLRDCSSISTLRRAVQTLNEEVFEVCFISETFPAEEVSPFFSDVEKLENKRITFIQVKEKVDPTIDDMAAKVLGFDCVLSRRGTQGDKQVIQEIEKILLEKSGFIKRVLDVKGAVTLLLRGLDRAAKDKRRGRIVSLPLVPANFIHSETTEIAKLAGEYFESLTAESEKAKPLPAYELNLPDSVQKKKLPGLDNRNYVGTSSRVWDRLARKFGTFEKK